MPLIEGRGLHLYPSLIDPDTTLGLIEISSVRATLDTTETGLMNPNARADIAFNPDSQLLPVALSAGILAAGVGPRGGLISGRSAAMLLDGWTREDMALRAPAAVYVSWPKMGINRTPGAKAAQEQAQFRKDRLLAIRDAFEDARAYAVRDAAKDERDVKWEALVDAVQRKIPVVVHADGVDEIRAAMKFAREENLRLILLGGRDAWRIAGEITCPVIYTHMATVPRDDEPYDVAYRAPGILARARVMVALSCGGGAAHVRNLPDFAGRAAAWGLPRLQALQAITIVPAQLLGVADRLGSLELGKDATFFLADGDILDTRTHVLRAWIGGREIDLKDRQKVLWEKYRNRPTR